ncbi:hypothetical protein Ae201684_009902 [Aphanomyces euteiches]|uniref:Uncharacterized protein n=1 Tax=Aphanomyces euteiches TaxID=100861 RepID=A0A6G0WZX9_9STRA|nr:hypothetical protein Ae201684_009902 [Aphanomyces euteiches]
MTKIQAQQTLTHSSVVVWNRFSIVYSLAFCLNLMAAPLKAYISETMPWNIAPESPNLAVEPYDNATLQYFQTLASSAPSSRAFVQDSSGFVFRKILYLPDAIDESDCFDSLQRFPIVAYYSAGFQQFVCDFLSQNKSTRNDGFQCQAIMMLGVSTMKYCFWMTLQDRTSSRYEVAVAGTTWEPPVFAWIKFVARLALGIYVGHQAWVHYYRHFRCLALNLTSLGIPGPFIKYEIYFGDATYFILSRPFVTLIFVLEFYLSIAYIGLACVRCSQLEDGMQFFLGCLYASRAVCFAYFVMRYATFAIKRFQWETFGRAIDPGLLALAAGLYAGPFFYVLTNTPTVHFVIWLNRVWVSPSLHGHAIEVLLLYDFIIGISATPLFHELQIHLSPSSVSF